MPSKNTAGKKKKYINNRKLKIKKRLKSSKKAKVVEKKVREKAVKAPKAPKASKAVLQKAKKEAQRETALKNLVHKGKKRGFITYDELLREFPQIEDDVLSLDSLYDTFAKEGIEIKKGGGILTDDEVDDGL